jgi:zinc protease
VRGGGFGGGGGGRGGRGGGGGGGGGPDSISLTISGSPEELEPGFQLAHLLLTQPRIEPTAFEQFKVGQKQGLEESLKNPQAFGGRIAGAAIYPETAAATQPLTLEQVDALTLPAAQAWLEKLIAESPIEVVVVGDIHRDQVMPLVEKYLGSLASRPKPAPTLYADRRKLQRPAGPVDVFRTVDTPTDQAYVSAGFYGSDQSNREDSRALAMAARILSTRMVTEVREKAQLVYSISAGNRPATTYPGFGLFAAAAPTQPEKAKPLAAKLHEMYDVFGKEGPTAEELEVAKKQMANTFETQLEDPAYWAGRLQRLTYRGADLNEIVNEPAAYQAVTAEQIKAVFNKYHTEKNAVTVVVVPALSK